MSYHDKVFTEELEIGQRIRPFGVIADMFLASPDVYTVTFNSGKTKNFRRRTRWWVDPPETENEKETNMVSHRRPKAAHETNPLGEREPELEDYVRKYETARQAAEKALSDARLIAMNPEQATLFLHEATVQAQLAQAASGMATAMATRGQAVEIRVAE